MYLDQHKYMPPRESGKRILEELFCVIGRESREGKLVEGVIARI